MVVINFCIYLIFVTDFSGTHIMVGTSLIGPRLVLRVFIKKLCKFCA